MDNRVCAPEDGRQIGTPAIMHPASGSRVGSNVALWGISTPASRVDILDGSEPLTSADVDDMGYWGASLRSMSGGVHELRVRAAGEEGRSRYSAPVRVVVEAGPAPVHEPEAPVPLKEEPRPIGPAPGQDEQAVVRPGPGVTEEPRRARPFLLAGSVLLAVAIVAAVLIFERAHIGTSPTPTTSARVVPTVSAPTPARSWQFPRPAGSADQAILTFNNPGAVQAVVTVRLPGSRQRLTLQPQGEAEMELGPQDKSQSIGISATAPIIVERIVVSNGTTSTSYGSHG